MGVCFSKNNKEGSDGFSPADDAPIGSVRNRNGSTTVTRAPLRSSSRNTAKPGTSTRDREVTCASAGTHPGVNIPFTSRTVDWLVLQTQLHVRACILTGALSVDPVALVMLSHIAETEEGFFLVIRSLVNGFPIVESPFLQDFVSTVLDGCDLPTKESASKFGSRLELDNDEKYNVGQKKNICLILVHMAVALGGQNTVLLTDEVMGFLIRLLNVKNKPSLILHAILTLEKFARTRENKSLITRALDELPSNPLVRLEKWKSATLSIKAQIGFCAQWVLDNYFIVTGRPFGYERVKNSNVRVILDSVHASEYLKISPNGLEARCDAPTFESARTTFQLDSGAWYYEAHILTEGIMQIGWASTATKFLNHEQKGVGDDDHSVAYDGSRKQIWHKEESEELEVPYWKSGDVVGVYLDLEKPEIIFYLNGQIVNTHTSVFEYSRTGFYAAASFSSGQQCVFNFGHRRFKFPPAGKTYNKFSQLPEVKGPLIALPKHIRQRDEALKLRRMSSVKDNSCTICCDLPASIRLSPCNHAGFCSQCADQLENCPVCRHEIENKVIALQ